MHVRLIFLVAALGFVISGCGGGGSEGGNAPPGAPGNERDASAGENNGGGVPGAPGNGDNTQRVPGSPIDIPNITDAEGERLTIARNRLENELKRVCGGTVCVRLKVEKRVAGRPDCRYLTTDPKPGTRVKRDSVVVIVVGTDPCDTESPDTDGNDGETPETETSPEDNGETSPEGDTPSTDTSPSG